MVVEELSIALKIFPEDFEVNYFLGLAYYSLKEFVNAEDFYKKALSLDTNSIPAMHALAMVYDQNEKWDQSDKLYTDLITKQIIGN